MTTKVEPTVEKWELDFDEAFEGTMCDGTGVDYGETQREVKDFIRTLLSLSVQEAKAERDDWWKKEISFLVLDLMSEDDGKKAERVGQKIHDLLSALNTKDSLKQEDEK